MKEIIATMKFTVDDDNAEDLKKALKHHSEWLIDLENWKGIHDYSTIQIEEHDVKED